MTATQQTPVFQTPPFQTPTFQTPIYETPSLSSAPTAPAGSGVVLILALVTTGLMAGVYYAYACSVMLGLGRTGDRTFIEAMQKINVAIQNPVFFLAFFGALVLTGVAAWQAKGAGGAAFAWTVAALALYTFGLLTTMAVNVPLNDKLAAAGDPAHLANPAAVRAAFEHTWNLWNLIRALASTGALACLGGALLTRSR